MEAKKIIELQKNVKELKKNYEYYNEFLYTPGLGAMISSLVNFETGDAVDFRILNFEKDEVPGMVLTTSPFAIGESGFINEENQSSQFVVDPNARYSYMAVVPKAILPALESMRFKSKEHIAIALEDACVSSAEFDGVISPEILSYPSLQEFFYLLNQWRSETGKVTLDDEVLMSAFLTVGEHMGETVENMEEAAGGRSGR